MINQERMWMLLLDLLGDLLENQFMYSDSLLERHSDLVQEYLKSLEGNQNEKD